MTELNPSTQPNTAKFYRALYYKAEQAFVDGDLETCDTTCRQLLEDEFCPMYFRASCNVMISDTDRHPKAKIREGLRVIAEIEEMVAAGAIEPQEQVTKLKTYAEELLEEMATVSSGDEGDEEEEVIEGDEDIAGLAEDKGKGKGKARDDAGAEEQGQTEEVAGDETGAEEATENGKDGTVGEAQVGKGKAGELMGRAFGHFIQTGRGFTPVPRAESQELPENLTEGETAVGTGTEPRASSPFASSETAVDLPRPGYQPGPSSPNKRARSTPSDDDEDEQDSKKPRAD